MTRSPMGAWPLALVLACAGGGDGTSTGGPPGAGGGGGGGTGGAGGAAGQPGAMVEPPGPEQVGPCMPGEPFSSPLRRLSNSEFSNTVRELLRDTSAPGDGLPTVLTVSPLLAEKYVEVAETLAANAVKNLPALLPCDPVRAGEEPCARMFIERFGRRAYRRPLAAAEVTRLLRVYTVGRTDATFARGIEVVLRAMLQSPYFLYKLEVGVPAKPGERIVRLTQNEVATRLSYLMWGGMPDDRLFAAADAGELATPEQVTRMARTMLDDPRARTAIVEWVRQWLGLAGLEVATKDPMAFREFNDALRSAMRAETQAFVENVLWTGDRRMATLLAAPYTFVNAPLAAVYGVPAPAGTALQRVMLDPAQRAGVLTQPGLMAVHSHGDQTSPVLRGKFVREHLLCQEAPPPPPDLMVNAPEVDPRRPTRERFTQHMRDPACNGCHQLMDPIGFGFEHYDPIGRYRAMDGGRPVDASGSIVNGGRDLDGPFRGARELADKLSKSVQVGECVATQWFRFALGRFEGTGDGCSLGRLKQAFAMSGYDLRELLVGLTQTDAFLSRRALTAQELQP